MRTPSQQACVHSSQQPMSSPRYESFPVACTREGTHEVLSARQILAWLEANGTQILIQQIPPGKRRKNRIILGFRLSDGELAAAGAVSIASAVAKARVRLQATECGRKGKP